MAWCARRIPMSAQDVSRPPAPRRPSETTTVTDAIELIKEYARQETIGPLRGAGRWVAYGVVGALLLAISVSFLMVGVLRMLQTEATETFSGNWMRIIPYLVALAIGILVIVVAASRIGKKPLNKEP
jgi:uncharacterized membrane protein